MPDLPADIICLIINELGRLIKEDDKPNPIAVRRARRSWLRLSTIRTQPRPRLAAYAGINAAWNAVVERETFHSIVVTPQRLSAFRDVVVKDPSRLSHIRLLEYHLGHEWNCVSSKSKGTEEKRVNDESFSRSVENMLWLLARLGSGDAQRERLAGVHLHIATCFTRSKEEHKEMQNYLEDDEIGEERWSEVPKQLWPGVGHTYLHYVGLELPKVRCITSFTYEEGSIWPASLMQILACLEDLETCKLRLSDIPTWHPESRRAYRKALGESLRLVPKSCTMFEARFENKGNGVYTQPAVLGSGLDPLCVGFRKISTRLRWLNLHDLRISPSLFWPQSNEDLNGETPYWRNLSSMNIHFTESDASGRWFALPDPDYPPDSDETSMRLFVSPIPNKRRLIDQDHINDILYAAARAATNMPQLENMYLHLQMPGPVSFKIGVDILGLDRSQKFLETCWDTRKETRLSSAILRLLGVDEKQLQETMISPETGTNKQVVTRARLRPGWPKYL